MHGDHGAQAGEEPLGAVDFRVSCDEAIQPAFDRALGFMHHMMYEQARSAFERVVEADPECAMARWGIATTLFQPLWPTRPSADDLQRAWTEIKKAKELEPGTERERKLVAATEAFFASPRRRTGGRASSAGQEAMEVARRAAPEDPDTAALYALSRLTLAPWAEDRQPLHAEAESVLRGIYDQVPTHPGAIHYTIHANDAAGRADKSLDIVKSYARSCRRACSPMRDPTGPTSSSPRATRPPG